MSISKDAFYNLGGTIVPMALSLLTIPIYMELIGEARYGVLAIVWLFLGYFGLFDFGLGRAVAQKVAVLGKARARERAGVIWTALLMTLSLSAVGIIVLWPIASYFFNEKLSIDVVLRKELSESIVWLLLALPVAMLSGIGNGAMQGDKRFFGLSLISIFSSVIVLAFPLFVAWIAGPGLELLIPATVISRLLAVFVLFLACHIFLMAGCSPSFSLKSGKELIKYGGWVTISSIVSPLMVVLDRALIGIELGAKHVTTYTVPFQLVEKISVIPNALALAILPRIASSQDFSQNTTTAQLSVRLLSLIMTPLVVLVIFFLEIFLSLWIDEDFARRAAPIGQILLVGFWINSFGRVAAVQLQASGRPDLVARCHLIEVAPYILTLYFALGEFGLIGAAVVFGCRTGFDTFLLLSFSRILKKTVVDIVVGLSILLLTLFTVRLGFLPNQYYYPAGVICCVMALGWSFFRLPVELKTRFWTD